jgi:hypothetical protein
MTNIREAAPEDVAGFYKKLGFQEEVEVPSSLVRRLPSGKFIPEIEMIKPGILY